MEDCKTDHHHILPSAVLIPKAPARRQGRWFLLSCLLIGVWVLRISKETTILPTVSQQNVEPGFDWFTLAPSEDIEWTSCFSDFKCARLILPLDYLSSPGGPNATIALQMLPATDMKNYKGTIFINPGGPGGSGTSFALQFGKNISSVVGPGYDILGFDPRGTGASTPNAQCFDSDSQYKIFALQAAEALVSLSDTSVPLARSRESAVSQRCQAALGGNGKEEMGATVEEWGGGRFMSTASVATDMLKITEKLGQEKLQYWGLSYGTVLGQYFSAMYPDKVGRVVIDGVYDGYNYRAGLWSSNLVDTDSVKNAFFTFCHQGGPAKCPLYEPTVEKIKDRVDSIVDSLETEPIPLAFASAGPTVFTKQAFIKMLFEATYRPIDRFGAVADVLVAAENKNTTTLAALTPQLGVECSCSQTPAWLADNEAFYFIACADSDPISYDADAYSAYFKDLNASSPFAAPIWGLTRIRCAQWTMRPKWRYMGPLSANDTANPVLVVSPMYDPVCPLSDARKVHARYAGSGLLVQNSYGHCSLSAPSICTAKHVRAYFENGTLPAEGTVCEVDELPFVGSVKNEVEAMSAEDQELLDALQGLVDAVPMFGHF